MLDLQQWPNLAIIALFVLVVVPAIMLAPLVGLRLFGPPSSGERHEASLEAFKLVGPLTGIFLSFSLVQGMGQFRTAELGVTHEAGDILQLDRALTTIGDGAGTATRLILRDYAHRLVDSEWPALRQGQPENAEAAALFAQLQGSAENLLGGDLSRNKPDVEKALDDIHDDRTARLGAASGGLPGVLWGITGALFVLLICTAAGLKPTRNWRVMLGFYATGLSLLAALFFIMGQPYRGDVAVSPRALEKAVSVMDMRLGHTHNP